jgi:hypothetical protein
LRERVAVVRELVELFEAAFFAGAFFFGFASFAGCDAPNIPSNPLMT